MATHDDHEIIEALERRNSSMQAQYDTVLPSFQDAAKWIDPARGRNLGESKNADRRKQRVLADSTARQSFRILKSGLMGGLTPQSSQWFKLGLLGYQEDDVSYDERAWLDECQRRMYEVMGAANVYHALSLCYGDLGLFGTYGGVLRSSYENVVHIQSYPVGTFLYAENDEAIVDTLHWTSDMTVRQIVKLFGYENCSHRVQALYDRNAMTDRVKVRAAIEPRLSRDPMSKLAADMPVGVYYWEAGQKDKLLHKGGLQQPGILAPRWETIADDPWPISSPGRDAVGDIRQLLSQQKDKDTAVQMGYKPPLVGTIAGSRFSYLPGAYNVSPVSDLNAQGVRAAFDVNVDLNAMMNGIQDTQNRIREAFFADLFRMASEYGMQGAKDVTATAIAEMKQEKLIVLGPVLESLFRGLLIPLVQGTFHYMQEAGILPPPPDSVVGHEVKVKFTSLLAQAQQAVGVAPIERTIGFAGTLAQLDPTVVQNLDGDAMLRNYGRQVGFPEKGFKSPSAVAQDRAAQAQQQQQQQLLENAQPLAQAANLISQASEHGQDVMAQQGIL